MNARRAGVVGAIVLALGAIAARAMHARHRAANVVASAASASVAPPPPPEPPAPKRVWRQSTRFPIVTGNPKDASWQMHENAPLVDPDDEPRPTTVLLHGMCADSSWTCDWLQYFELAPQWMICPRAPSHCGEGGYQWSTAAENLRAVQAAIASTQSRHGDRMRTDAIVLSGFSQGAYAVASLVRALAAGGALVDGGVLRGVVLQGAEVRVDAAAARKLGVRVALTAGERDGAAPAMRAEAARLQREGIDARYESLGKDEGHFTSVSTGKIVAELVDWARAR